MKADNPDSRESPMPTVRLPSSLSLSGSESVSASSSSGEAAAGALDGGADAVETALGGRPPVVVAGAAP
jgi:hypothetical protein